MRRLPSPMIALATLVPLMLTTLPSSAEIKVVASIKPIHSLVARVMGDTGTPAILVNGAASPHGFALRPSQAQALQDADLVFWIGHNLETFLEKPLESVAADATAIELGDLEGMTLLPVREGGDFEEHEPHEGEEHAEEDHAHEAGHHGEGFDPHVWLDTRNAIVMVDAIAQALAKADPENALKYNDNAAQAESELKALESKLVEATASVKGTPFIVFHDAYQYFENRFGVPAAGSITLNPEVMPGAERLTQIRDKLKQSGARCVFAEPQFEPRLVTVAMEGTQARSATLDPIGAALQPGPDLYPTLLGELTKSLVDCLSTK